MAYLGCNIYLTGSSGHKHNRLVLVCTDQSFGICRREVLCTKLDENGSIIYINWCCILFGCAQTKKSDRGQSSDIVEYHRSVHWSCDET